MNSRNLSEKGFDAEIKGRLENSSVLFDPESWEKMSQKLDHVFPNNNSGDSGSFGLLVVAFLLSAWFFWNVGTFQGQPLNDQKLAPSALLERDKDIKAEQVKDNKGLLQENELANRALNSKTTFSSPEDNSAVITPGTDSNNSEVSNSGVSNSEVSNSNYTQTSTQFLTINDNLKGQGQMEVETNLGVQSLTLIASNAPEIESIDRQNLPDEIKEIDLNTTEEPPVIATPSSRWFLGFGYGPDISLVGFSETTKPGTNLSILLEYQLNRRWSINSGITYSRKNYKAKGKDYHPPKGFWDYGVVPDMTDGTCEVIDIPINIRYYFNLAKVNRLFASTGLSTYLMLTEDYYYQYEDNSSHLVQSWSGKNENQHYFAIYNLSVGYQRWMGKQWFFEVEPFVKLPLTGVGFGEVDLWSTGVAFSIKYNFR